MGVIAQPHQMKKLAGQSRREQRETSLKEGKKIILPADKALR